MTCRSAATPANACDSAALDAAAPLGFQLRVVGVGDLVRVRRANPRPRAGVDARHRGSGCVAAQRVDETAPAGWARVASPRQTRAAARSGLGSGATALRCSDSSRTPARDRGTRSELLAQLAEVADVRALDRHLLERGAGDVRAARPFLVPLDAHRQAAGRADGYIALRPHRDTPRPEHRGTERALELAAQVSVGGGQPKADAAVEHATERGHRFDPGLAVLIASARDAIHTRKRADGIRSIRPRKPALVVERSAQSRGWWRRFASASPACAASCRCQLSSFDTRSPDAGASPVKPLDSPRSTLPPQVNAPGRAGRVGHGAGRSLAARLQQSIAAAGAHRSS